MRSALEAAGDVPFSEISRKKIVEGRDRRATAPSMTRPFVDTMRGMFEWGGDAEIAKDRPDVQRPSREAEDGGSSGLV